MNTTNDWQTWAALGLVVLTVAAFLAHRLSRDKTGGCGGGCGCDSAKKPKLPWVNH